MDETFDNVAEKLANMAFLDPNLSTLGKRDPLERSQTAYNLTWRITVSSFMLIHAQVI